MKHLLEPLNLIYYEYDEKMNTLFLDKDGPKNHTFNELMKITYALSAQEIDYFVDEEKSIVISSKNTILSKCKRLVHCALSNLKNQNMNIYILSDKKVKWAKNIPIFDIKPIKQKIDLTNYDALIFTSKNAIYSLDTMDSSWKKKPAYAIAPQTAKIIKALGGTLKFVGKEKHGDEFAMEVVKKFKHEKLLYVRASKVVSDFVNILKKNNVFCDELIIYETICKEFDEKIKLPKNSTIIFSSPSTVECFFKNTTWDESFKAVSIGDTTAKFFPKNITPAIAQTTSLDACVRKAIELNK